MTINLRRLAPLALLPFVLALSAVDAGAAAQKKAASPFQGFSSDSGKPVDVKSDSLEVHQDENKAIFTGNVVATQGDSVLHTNELTVFYDNSVMNGGSGGGKKGDKAAADAGDAPKAGDATKPADATKSADAATPADAAKATDTQPAAASGDQAAGKPAGSDTTAQPAASGQAGSSGQTNSIKKLIAKGNVVVTSKDQKATGDYGIMDMATNLATLTGNEVVMIQGPNVLKGKKLVVNLKTGVANVQGGGSGVSGVFTQSNDQKNDQKKKSN